MYVLNFILFFSTFFPFGKFVLGKFQHYQLVWKLPRSCSKQAFGIGTMACIWYSPMGMWILNNGWIKVTQEGTTLCFFYMSFNLLFLDKICMCNLLTLSWYQAAVKCLILVSIFYHSKLILLTNLPDFACINLMMKWLWHKPHCSLCFQPSGRRDKHTSTFQRN